MKKLLAAILMVVVMLTSLVLPASAEAGKTSTSATLSDDKTSFTVSFKLDSNPGIIALNLAVSYDSKVVKLKSAKNGSIFEDVQQYGPNYSANPYIIIWMEATAPEDIKSTGVLATYTFEVLKNAPNGESEIKFDIVEALNVDLEDVKFSGSSVKINVNDNATSSKPTGSQAPDSTQSKPITGSDSNNTVTNGQVIDVEKPEFDNTVTDEEAEQAPDGTTQKDDVEIDVTPEAEDNTAEKNKKGKSKDNKNSNRTLNTIIIIAAILIVGGSITVAAIYFRKKSSNKNK